MTRKRKRKTSAVANEGSDILKNQPPVADGEVVQTTAETGALDTSHDTINQERKPPSRTEIALEEKILLLESSLELLNARKELVSKQVKLASARKDRLARLQVAQAKHLQQLKDTRRKHEELLNQLMKTLTKSQEIFTRLTSSSDAGLSNDEIARLTEELRNQEELRKQQEKQAQATDNLALESVAALESKQQGEVVQRSNQPVESMLLTEKHKRWVMEFWKQHGDLTKNCLMSFIPMIGSASLLTRIFDLYRTEVLAWGSNNDAAEFRREILRNTCLDLMLMAASPIKESSHRPEWRINDEPSVEEGKEQSIDAPANAIDNTNGDPFEQSAIDPNVALCPFDLTGSCVDPFCPYQHLNTPEKEGRTSKILPKELLTLPPLSLPSQPQQDPGFNNTTAPTTIDRSICVDDVGDKGQQVGASDNLEREGDEEVFSQGLARQQEKALLGTAFPEVTQAQDTVMTDSEFTDNTDFVALSVGEPSEENLVISQGTPIGLQASLEEVDSSSSIDVMKLWWFDESDPDLNQGRNSLLSFDAWLHQFGKFSVTQDSIENKSRSLNYIGTHPKTFLDHVAFVGKVVDCTMLAIHAGRYDVATQLYNITNQQLNIKKNTVKVPKLKPVIKLLRGATETAFQSQNGFRTTLNIQLRLAFLSHLLRELHIKLDQSQKLNTSAVADCVDIDKWSKTVVRLGKGLSEGAGFLVERVELEQQGFASRLFWAFWRQERLQSGSPPLARNIADEFDAISFAVGLSLTVQNEFSLDQADQIFDSLFSLIKNVLAEDQRNVSERKPLLRLVMFVGYILLAVLEKLTGVIVGWKMTPQKISALVQLEQGFNRTIATLKKAIAEDPILQCLVTPLLAADVSLVALIRQYDKVQHRLEEYLRPEFHTIDPSFCFSFYVYSELLWSQLFHLQASLPFIGQVHEKNNQLRTMGEVQKPCSDQQTRMVNRISGYGILLHHICLQGDWNVLCRLNNGKSKRKQCYLLFEAILRGPQHESIFTSFDLEHSPTIFPDNFRSSFSHVSGFPFSLLLAGRTLKVLSLKNSHVTVLPSTFGIYFPNVEVLNISGNRLKDIPTSISKLTNLKTLDASENHLSALNGSFGDLSRLFSLNLAGNMFSTFPSAILKCVLIEELDLSLNFLGFASPSQLAMDLPKLRILNIAPQRDSPTNKQS